MKHTLRFFSLFLAASLCAGCALADTLSLSGSVTAGTTREVYSPIGGTVASVSTEAGQQVSAGDVLLTLKTNKVYAETDGTVTGIFGEPGDSAETVAQRYGAVMYLEGESVYKVSASTENAYNSTATKFVHVGETVYMQCRTNSSRKGEGVITGIEGTSYTVEVRSGSFIPGDSVNIFRDSAFTDSKRVGRGTVQRQSPTAVTASGSIVRFAVSDGDQVSRGDLLLETLDGSFDGLYMSGENILAGVDGIIKTIKAEQGSSVQKNSVVAVLYTKESMRVEAELPEDSLNDIAVGDEVKIELESDESHTYSGRVSMISGIASESAGSENGVTYRMVIDFEPDEAVRYGMNVLVSTPEAEEPETEESETNENADSEKEVNSDARDGKRSGKPENGFSGGNFPEGGFPENMQQDDGTAKNE